MAVMAHREQRKHTGAPYAGSIVRWEPNSSSRLHHDHSLADNVQVDLLVQIQSRPAHRPVEDRLVSAGYVRPPEKPCA